MQSAVLMRGLISLILLIAAASSARAAPIEVYFSPDGGAEQAVVRALASADERVDLAIYSLSNAAIVHALRSAADRGVDIRILADSGQRTLGYSAAPQLSCLLPVRYDTLSGLLHDKYAVIDEQLVLTGSFNWTASAQQRNAENLLVIDDPGLARSFEHDFDHLWAHDSVAAPPCADTPVVQGGAPTLRSASGATVRLSVDAKAERVTIRNAGDDALDLSGWVLLSVEGDQRYVLPAGTRLTPGVALVVASGRSAEPAANVLVWTRAYMWNNEGDHAQLYDGDGDLVAVAG